MVLQRQRPGQSTRAPLQIHPEVARAGAAAALDVLRSTARAPPGDVYAARNGGGGTPVSLQTQVEETRGAPEVGDAAGPGVANPTPVIMRHYQQLEVWPLGLDGEHPMRLTRKEYAVTAASTPDSQVAATEGTRSVAVQFSVHGQARAASLVHQWEKILSPGANARRVGTTSLAAAAAAAGGGGAGGTAGSG